jgi:hypothetical protein
VHASTRFWCNHNKVHHPLHGCVCKGASDIGWMTHSAIPLCAHTHLSLSLSLSLSSIYLSIYLSTNLVSTHMGHHFHPRVSHLNMVVHVMSFFLLSAWPTTNDEDNNAVKPTIQLQTTQFLRYPWEARQGRGGEGREDEDLGGGRSGVSEDYKPWTDVFMDDEWMNEWMVGSSHPWRLNLKVYKVLWTKSNVDGWGGRGQRGS